MNINSSSYFSVGGSTSGASNGGISGLMSGMDTEAMVEKMLSGTQNKIDKQEALKQQTLWKQDIYRDVITSINSFRSKYFNTSFGASSKNNFASSAFFNAMKSVVKSGDAVRVSGSTSNTSVGDIKVKVKQLATASKLETDVNLSTNQITGTTLSDVAMNERLNRQLTLKIGSSTMTVDLNGVKSQGDLADTLNNAFSTVSDSSAFKGVTASVDKGILHLQTADPAKEIEVDSSTTAAALALTGLTNHSTIDIKNADGTVIGKQLGGHSSVNTKTGLTFDLSLDGVQKTIRLDNVPADYTDPTSPNFGKITVDAVHKALQDQVKKAFGDYVEVGLTSDNKLSFAVNIKNGGVVEQGHELIVTGVDAKGLGITPGASTRINFSTKLGDLGLGGDQFEFTINGVDFKFDGDTTVSKMMSTINSSSAGVRMSYSSLADTFKLEATNTGAKYGIEIKQTKGNALGRMFGTDKIAESDSAATKKMITDGIQGTALTSGYTTKAAKLTMNVNGTNYTFSLPKKEDDATYNQTEIADKFNEWLKEKFHETDAAGEKIAQITYDGGTGKLNVLGGQYNVKFAASSVDPTDSEAVDKAMESDLAYAMGFNRTATSNEVTKDTNLTDILQLKGLSPSDLAAFKKADGTAATTIGDVASIDGLTGVTGVTYADGRLTLKGSGTVDLSAQPHLATLFGATELQLGDGKMVGTPVTAGVDAKISINGIDTTRSGNSFTVDGITMELSKVSNEIKDAAGNVTDYEETVISSSRDTDSVVEGFKTFVEDYNAMIKKLNDYIGEEDSYRDYAPLTAAQKKELSESEIKLWEENAKKGLVRRDSTISSFLSEMRLAMYTKPEGSSLALYNIGVDTASNSYQDKGKLYLDEAALRSALTTDPESVNTLFTSATDGLSAVMMKAMKSAAETSSGSPGALVELAGIKGTTTEKNNTLYNKILDINDRISDLKYKYEREKARYWAQFNSMESVLSNYNSQSMWMTQQFSGQ